MIDRFGEILQELGTVFDMRLHIDKVGACSILIPPNPTVTLQLDTTQEFLLMFSKIIEVPPGKFRENVFSEALKANSEPDPRPGVLGYIASSNLLAMYQKFPAAMLDGERLASLIGSFLEMAEKWRKALQRGESGPK